VSALPRVHVVATGGTIAMTGSPARPARSGAELVAAVPGLAGVAELEVAELSNVPGAQLTPSAMARAVAAAAGAAADGAAGAVVLQGTDTIEETAELASLAWGDGAPLAITGAIRPGGLPGSDGPRNLLDAVALAASPAAREAGVVVVFDGVVHRGTAATKGDSWRSDAFWSPAPLGEVREGIVSLGPPGAPAPPLAAPAELAAAPLDAQRVAILGVAAGSDGRELDALVAGGARAVVLWSLGAGHVPAAMLPAIDRALSAGVPVIACAGTPRGGTLARTYGFDGSETDLARRGALLAGPLTPRKARIRLIAALALGRDPAEAIRPARS
jgi:L-asparaginase